MLHPNLHHAELDACAHDLPWAERGGGQQYLVVCHAVFACSYPLWTERLPAKVLVLLQIQFRTDGHEWLKLTNLWSAVLFVCR